MIINGAFEEFIKFFSEVFHTEGLEASISISKTSL